MADISVSEQILQKFPKDVRLLIDVVFPGEYRVGFAYQDIEFIPGVASYYSFKEALARCYLAFCAKRLPPASFKVGDQVLIPTGDIGLITDSFDHDGATFFTVAPAQQKTVFVGDDGGSQPMEIYGDYEAGELARFEPVVPARLR